MDQLWAPWRISYLSKPKTTLAAGDCFVCHGLAESNDRENLIVARRSCCVVILNRYPYNNGHLLICPLLHKSHLQDLTPEEVHDIFEMQRQLVGALDELMRPHGYNIGLNLGAAAGAGLPGHLHWHLVPRWNGDNNFMPVIGDTRVISQSLEALYDLLHPKLN